MTDAPEPNEPLSPALGMAVLAAGGFVLAKVLVVGHLLTGSFGMQLLPAVATSLGGDALVVLALAGLGLLAERVFGATSRVLRGVLSAIGVVLAIYALLNVVLVVEIGRPVTIEMLSVGVGTGEAWSVVGTAGGHLALFGAGFYLLAAVPVMRWLHRRVPRPGRRAAAALAVYSVVAFALVRADPMVAAIYGLHRNAVLELALGVLGETGWLADADSSTLDLSKVDFPVPDGASWTAPVPVPGDWRPKHVVLWFAESTGAEYTSLFDPEGGATPNLARLQEHGLLFTRYYSTAPLSEKALFTILCGLYPYPSNRPMGTINPRIACPSLMETLVSRGYRAGFFTGATFGFGDKQRLLAERGFDTMIDSDTVPGRSKYWHDAWGVDDAAIVAEALRWLDARPDPDQPQLTVMVPIIPHVPYGMPKDAPTPYGTDTPRAVYMNGVHYSDSLFERLYEAYVERGLADDTLFVWVGDHGEAFGQHPGSAGHASFIYEENVHVGLLFINPRLFPTHEVSERLGTHVDVMPTILDLLGQSAPEGGDGQSLVSDDYRYKPAFLGAFMRDRLGGLRDGQYKYIYNYETGFEEVYDLTADPHEADNLADTFDPERVATWRAWVQAEQARQKRFIEDHAVVGPPYMERVLKGLKVSLVDGDHVVQCTQVTGVRTLGCPGAPKEVAVTLKWDKVHFVSRHCIAVHPPPRGSMVLEFPPVDPAPRLIGAGLFDSSRVAGGTPLEVTWHIGDLDPIAMTVDDPNPEAYVAMRVPATGTTGPVPVRVEIRSDDWVNREGCLILSP